MDKNAPPRAFNTFNPAGHVVIAMPAADTVDALKQDLQDAGISEDQVVVYQPDEMLALAEREVSEATLAARIGQEYNLAKLRRDLAASGHAFVVVPTGRDEQVQRVADLARRHRATRAQRYGTFIIEELVEVGDGLTQVGESPERGIDAQTRSGHEPPPEQPRNAPR